MPNRPYPIPDQEKRRLAALAAYEVMDTLPEVAYDGFTRLAAIICETPIALITLLDEDRQWFKSKLGLDAPETPRDQAFCAHAIVHPGEIMAVKDATQDPRFVDNPLVTGEPEIRFYAGAPLVTPAGDALGTLCVIDREPRELSDEQREALRILSGGVVRLLELRRTIEGLEDALLEQDTYLEKQAEYQRELESLEEELLVQSTTDSVTGLGNRRAFDQRVEEEHERARRYRVSYSILVIDVDNLKEINDAGGHPAGDAALQHVADVLKGSARASDFVARYGGDEFVVILPNTRERAALVMAERIRRRVAAGGPSGAGVTVSVGVASLPSGASTAQEVVAAADAALYRSKRAGRNRVEGPVVGPEARDTGDTGDTGDTRGEWRSAASG